MERSLYSNDSDFVATVGGRRGRPNYTMVVIGVLAFALGRDAFLGLFGATAAELGRFMYFLGQEQQAMEAEARAA